MAHEAERLLTAIVSDYQQRAVNVYTANRTDGSFTIPEGTSGNTFFTGWGDNRKATFEFGTGGTAAAARQVVAVLRFKRDPADTTYGYVLDAIEVPPQRELHAGTDFNPTSNLTVDALYAAKQFYVHACTRGTGQKEAAMQALQAALTSSRITAPAGQQTPAQGTYSREARLRARYNTNTSPPGAADVRQYEEDARRILRGPGYH